MTQDVSQELVGLQQRQITGTLVVQGQGQQWWLYLFMGRLLYATGGAHRVRRWYRVTKAHCPQFQPDWNALGNATPWEYHSLVYGTANGRLTPSQAKAVILASVLEVLFALVGRANLTLTLQAGQGLGTQIALLQVERVLQEVAQLQQQWHATGMDQFPNPIPGLSPDFAPVLKQADKISEQPGGVPWVALCNGQNTLWDIMSQTRKSLQATVQPLVGWAQQGWLEWQTLPDLASPVAETGPVPPPTPPFPHSQTHQPLVACLDDSPVMLKILETSLVRAGYRVMTVAQPMIQMGQLLEAKPDVILMDWVMPDVNGYELCGLLRKTSVFKDQ